LLYTKFLFLFLLTTRAIIIHNRWQGTHMSWESWRSWWTEQKNHFQALWWRYWWALQGL